MKFVRKYAVRRECLLRIRLQPDPQSRQTLRTGSSRTYKPVLELTRLSTLPPRLVRHKQEQPSRPASASTGPPAGGSAHTTVLNRTILRAIVKNNAQLSPHCVNMSEHCLCSRRSAPKSFIGSANFQPPFWLPKNGKFPSGSGAGKNVLEATMFVLRRTAAASLLAALAAISTPDTVRAFTSSPVPVSSAAGMRRPTSDDPDKEHPPHLRPRPAPKRLLMAPPHRYRYLPGCSSD